MPSNAFIVYCPYLLLVFLPLLIEATNNALRIQQSETSSLPQKLDIEVGPVLVRNNVEKSSKLENIGSKQTDANSDMSALNSNASTDNGPVPPHDDTAKGAGTIPLSMVIPVEAYTTGFKRAGEYCQQQQQTQPTKANKACCANNGKEKNADKNPSSEIGKWMRREYAFGHGSRRFMLSEYLPSVFCRLRQIFDVKTENYYSSLSADGMVAWQNAGMSGSIFFLSADQHYMLKSVNARERHILNGRLDSYAEHMDNNGNSLLTKYHGLYSIRSADSNGNANAANMSNDHDGNDDAADDGAIWFFVMDNLEVPPALSLPPPSLPTTTKPMAISVLPASIDNRYDFKGYYLWRKEWRPLKIATPGWTFREWEFNNPNNPNAQFKEGILLEENTYKMVMDSLSQDLRFLSKSFFAIDYSLFMAIHFNNERENVEAEELEERTSTSDSPQKIKSNSDDRDMSSSCLIPFLKHFFSSNRKNRGCRPLAQQPPSDHHQIMRMRNGGIPARCRKCQRPERLQQQQNGTGNGNGGTSGITIFFGIIDLLFKWKAWACFGMVKMIYIDRAANERQIHTTPSKYAARMKCYVGSRVFRVQNEEAMKEYTEKYCHDYNTAQWNDKWTKSDEERTFGFQIPRRNQIHRIAKYGHFGITEHGQSI